VFGGLPPEKLTLASCTLTQCYSRSGAEFLMLLGRFISESWKPSIAFNKGVIDMPDPLAEFIACYRDRAVMAARRMKIEVVYKGEEIERSVSEDVEERGIEVITEIDWDFYQQVTFAMMDHH
jgi:hypothetical protein